MGATTPIPITPSQTPAAPTQPVLPFLDLRAQFEGIREEVMRAVEGVFDSQQFILGKEVQLLEKEVAALVGVPYAIGCASGSDALYLALLAEGIGVGDEVITTPFTFVATAGAIARTGAKPVFVDIQRDTFNIDPVLIERAVTGRTRAIIPVHLFGQPADLEPILTVARRWSLAIIEDAAQAIGASYHGRQVGSLGPFGCFSFFPSKNLGCAGDGGMITTQDEKLADRLRLLRAHGSRRKYHYEILGMNSRLDALQAAILRVKLRRLKTWEEGRRTRATIYLRLFEHHRLTDTVALPVTAPDRTHVFNQFVIRVKDRDVLRGYLHAHGVPTDIYYPSPLHLQPAFAYLGYTAGSLPESEAAAEQTLALPIYPELRDEHQEHIVRTIAEFYSSRTTN